MLGPLLEAILPLIMGWRFVGSLILAIGSTFIGAWIGGETGAMIAFFATFGLVYGGWFLADQRKSDTP
jgi:hypothetical protein